VSEEKRDLEWDRYKIKRKNVRSGEREIKKEE